MLSVVLAMIAFVAPALLMALASSVAQSAFEKCHQHYYCIVHRGWKMKGMDSQWANYVASLEETSRSGNFIYVSRGKNIRKTLKTTLFARFSHFPRFSATCFAGRKARVSNPAKNCGLKSCCNIFPSNILM